MIAGSSAFHYEGQRQTNSPIIQATLTNNYRISNFDGAERGPKYGCYYGAVVFNNYLIVSGQTSIIESKGAAIATCTLEGSSKINVTELGLSVVKVKFLQVGSTLYAQYVDYWRWIKLAYSGNGVSWITGVTQCYGNTSPSIVDTCPVSDTEGYFIAKDNATSLSTLTGGWVNLTYFNTTGGVSRIIDTPHFYWYATPGNLGTVVNVARINDADGSVKYDGVLLSTYRGNVLSDDTANYHPENMAENLLYSMRSDTRSVYGTKRIFNPLTFNFIKNSDSWVSANLPTCVSVYPHYLDSSLNYNVLIDVFTESGLDPSGGLYNGRHEEISRLWLSTRDFINFRYLYAGVSVYYSTGTVMYGISSQYIILSCYRSDIIEYRTGSVDVSNDVISYSNTDNETVNILLGNQR